MDGWMDGSNWGNKPKIKKKKNTAVPVDSKKHHGSLKCNRCFKESEATKVDTSEKEKSYKKQTSVGGVRAMLTHII